MRDPSDKKKKTSIAISDRTLAGLKERARHEMRSLSNFLELCFKRILEEEPEKQKRRNRAIERLLKGLIFAAGSGLIAFSPAQMPPSQCKHFCIPPTSPMWEVLPGS
jgi:hypothetical protein